eukprot:SAG22_NODE_7130_length_772_cov_1.661218_1_plen_135_part_01
MAAVTTMSRKDWLARISARRDGTNSDSSLATTMTTMTSDFKSPPVRKEVDMSIGSGIGGRDSRAGAASSGGGSSGGMPAIDRHHSSPLDRPLNGDSDEDAPAPAPAPMSREQAAKLFADTLLQGEKELSVAYRDA